MPPFLVLFFFPGRNVKRYTNLLPIPPPPRATQTNINTKIQHCGVNADTCSTNGIKTRDEFDSKSNYEQYYPDM
jgi:hypothetical protein